MSKKHKKRFKLHWQLTLVGIPIGIMSSETGLKICAITTGIKKCKFIIRKKSRIK